MLCLGWIHPSHHALFVRSARDYSANSAVFADVQYRTLLPLLLQILLVLIPILRGLRDACHVRRSGWEKGALWFLLTLALFSLVTQALAWWQYRTWNLTPAPGPHLPSLLPLALAGVAACYMAQRLPQQSVSQHI
jgi:hypothetical protein